MYASTGVPNDATCVVSPSLAKRGDAATARAPSEVGADQMDALVDGMRRSSVGRQSTQGGGPGQPRARRRENSAAPSDWGSLGTGPGPGRTSPRSSTPHHSRDSSAASDTSFASLDAGPTPAQLAAPLFPPSGDGDGDVTGAPSMARQETLKAIERPWMSSVAIGGEVPRTPEQLRQAYRASASPTSRRRSSETGEGALSKSGASPRRGARTPPPGGALLDAPRTPPGGIRRLSLLPSAGLSPRSARRASSTADDQPLGPSVPRNPPDTAKPLPPPPPLLPYVPFPASSPAASLAVPDPRTPSRPKSIEEIIAQHAPPTYLSARRASASTSASGPGPAAASGRAREESAATLPSLAGRSSTDSLAAELRGTAAAQDAFDGRRDAPPSLQRATLVGTAVPSMDELGPPPYARSTASTEGFPTPRVSSPFSPSFSAADAPDSERELARLLKSPRLTRLFTLRQPPNKGLTVSLADVGSASGHPVLVFLGLGGVRHLIALYDDLAEALGLRLICVDRWGLGRTGDVPQGQQRGFLEWARVVAELVSPSHLDLARFSVLAHSAGAPYAVAAALHPELAPRVRGSLHLLAPWVSCGADSLAGPYRYLRHVPASVLKAAQAAEWKVQGWRLGKPPALALEHAPVGWDARTGRLMNGEELEREDERRSEEVGRGVELLNGGSPTNARKLEVLYPDGALVRAGPTATPPPVGAAKTKGLKASWGGLFGGGGGGGLGSPKRPESPLDAASPRSRTSFLSPLPSSAGRRASFFGGMSRSSPPPDSTDSASARKLAPSGLPQGTPSRRSSLFSASPLPSPTTPSFRQPSVTPSVASSSSHCPSTRLRDTASRSPPPRRERLPSAVSSTPSHPSSGTHTSRSRAERPSLPPAQLTSGLLRASHAESDRGGAAADLLVLLERTSSPGRERGGMGFAYGDVPHRVTVWHGERDDRISLASVRWLEGELERGRAGERAREDGRGDKACEVRVVKDGDHSLMASESALVLLCLLRLR